MRFIELVEQNNILKFFDAELAETLTFKQIFNCDFDLESDQKLAFLYLDNSLDAIRVFFNFFKSNHTIALLSPKVNESYKENLEKLYCPFYIFDSTRKCIHNYATHGFINELNVFKANFQSNYAISKRIKLLLSTSGTTGSPKFVKLSEENLIQNALSIIDYLPIKHNDVTPINLPLFYSYGLSVFTTNCIAGGKIVCTNKDFLMKDFWDDLNLYQYTSLAGVPFAYEMLLRIGFTRKKYPSLRYMTQAGGKLNEKTIKVFTEYCNQENILFFIMYGQTEATARMAFLPPEYLNVKFGSIGKPIKNGSFSLDPLTEELCYKGPNVFGGYANTADELATYDDIEVLKTGDIAKLDEDGFYYITGRLKRIVKIFGYRVNLDEIESMLKNQFTGTTFVCIGLDDSKIFIGINDEQVELNAVSEFVASAMKIHPSVILVDILKEIPLTENGKIDYTSIYERYKY